MSTNKNRPKSDASLRVAIITTAGVILAALITGMFSLYAETIKSNQATHTASSEILPAPYIIIQEPSFSVRSEKFEVVGTFGGLQESSEIWVFVRVEGSDDYWLQKLTETERTGVVEGKWRTIAVSADQDIGKSLLIIAVVINDGETNAYVHEYFSNRNAIGLLALPPNILAEDRITVDRLNNETPAPLPSGPTQVFVLPTPLLSNPKECEDSVDNDKDGFIDFPGDPDCTSSSDPSE